MVPSSKNDAWKLMTLCGLRALDDPHIMCVKFVLVGYQMRWLIGLSQCKNTQDSDTSCDHSVSSASPVLTTTAATPLVHKHTHI